MAATGSNPLLKVGSVTVRADGVGGMLDEQTKQHRVPFGSFGPADDSTRWKRTAGYLTVGAANTESVFYAPVSLHDGVTITRIAARLFRAVSVSPPNAPTIEVELIRASDGTETPIATASFKGMSTGWQSFNSSAISEDVQTGELGLYSYALKATLVTDISDDDGVRLSHVDVEYVSPGYRAP